MGTKNRTMHEFFNTIYTMRKTDHIKILCSNGNCIKIQKNHFPNLKAFYFEKGSNQPCAVSDTDFETIKTVLISQV